MPIHCENCFTIDDGFYKTILLNRNFLGYLQENCSIAAGLLDECNIIFNLSKGRYGNAVALANEWASRSRCFHEIYEAVKQISESQASNLLDIARKYRLGDNYDPSICAASIETNAAKGSELKNVADDSKINTTKGREVRIIDSDEMKKIISDSNNANVEMTPLTKGGGIVFNDMRFTGNNMPQIGKMAGKFKLIVTSKDGNVQEYYVL